MNLSNAGCVSSHQTALLLQLKLFVSCYLCLPSCPLEEDRLQPNNKMVLKTQVTQGLLSSEQKTYRNSYCMSTTISYYTIIKVRSEEAHTTTEVASWTHWYEL